jgi:voltage-gated potassium channel
LTGVVATAYTTQVERREVMFESTIREALADGVVTEAERENLERLKKQFGMSDEKVQTIERQVREEKAQQAKMQSSQLA